MTERKPPHSLEDLDARVREAQRRQAGAGPARDNEKAGGSALGMAWRVGIELVSALVVGVAIGYMLDRWLGTKPWLLIVFFVLGSAAGVLNVFRATSGLGGTVGYRKRLTDAKPDGKGKNGEG
ncbi:MAG TPA: AtpZ/AtpI family protein [Alphaproteobacteria bacterium]|nr:AtpZ/AtpI family protein [Alphaproteobacteria bacterium]